MSNSRSLWILVFCVIAGCSSTDTGDILATVKVSGTVTWNGKPLEFHKVTFIPEGSRPASGVSDETKGTRPASGVSDEKGKFVLGTNQPGDGAVVGKYQVSVVYVGPPETNPEAGINDFSGPPTPKLKIPPKYNDPSKSGLKFEVTSNGLTDLVIDLK